MATDEGTKEGVLINVECSDDEYADPSTFFEEDSIQQTVLSSLSTKTIVNNDNTLVNITSSHVMDEDVPGKQLADEFEDQIEAMDDEEEENGNIALFVEPAMPYFSNYLKAHVTPGPNERRLSKKLRKKANLGVLLGVYLPTLQHILGVTMFIRLFWLVGIAGLAQTFSLVLLCCLCTLLTCISISAVATNGVVESGGAYFMISRNLGPEFGTAIGLLFYLANTVATSMYLMGGVEILLLYIFPDLTIGGVEVQSDTGPFGQMTYNYRIYASALLVLECLIVAMGVKFVQMLAPVSLVCVILSVLACYAGGVEKTLYPDAGQSVCMYGRRLLQSQIVLPPHASLSEICDYCGYNNTVLMDKLCFNNTCLGDPYDVPFACINGFPGFRSSNLLQNIGPQYVGKFEAAVGEPADIKTDVFQDVRTSFYVLLAIYFPAVTGIFTGANMSGDLKNPQQSIPRGTIAATLTTSFIYFSLAFLFGSCIDGNVLRDKRGASLNGNMVVALLSWPSPWVLLIGSFLSTFGAALQCLCSAPRLLQSIAKDEVLPFLSVFKRVNSKNEPLLGLLLTACIAEAAILVGAMDRIAAVVDFFFLMCYAFVNLICVLHSLLGAPNWRPRFQYYHWFLSLLGAGLCFFIMFSTHWEYAIISCALCLLVYKYVEWKGAKKEWGDGIRGLALTTAQYSLMKIEDKDPHPKNWRPQLLIMMSTVSSSENVDGKYCNILYLASQLKAGRGLTVVTSFIRGSLNNAEDKKRAEETKAKIDMDMNKCRLRGFAKTLVHEEGQVLGSMSTLIQSVGLGGLKPNTMLIAWPVHGRGTSTSDSEYSTFADKLSAACAMDMCLLVAKGIVDFPKSCSRLSGYIDVYWVFHDGGLCLLVSYLLKQHKVWRGCKLRVIAIAQPSDSYFELQKEVQQHIYQLRIQAEITTVALAEPQLPPNAYEHSLVTEEQANEMLDNNLEFSEETLLPSSYGDATRMSKAQEAYCQRRAKNDEMRARDKVYKMHTAFRLNQIISTHSADSQLVLLNLPKPLHGPEGLDNYVRYLEVLSKGVRRLIFVRGSGQEVITSHS